MTLIDQRPVEVEGCAVSGHREGGLITGVGSENALWVIVERKSRFVQIDLLETYNAQAARKTIERRFKRLGADW
jgi:IS30 family transposase